MRGARQHRRQAHAGGRIIPAYAGSTSASGRASIRGEDHPRVCGEHASAAGWNVEPRESSPRMRGAPQPEAIRRENVRIIPAYAGSTSGSAYRSLGSRGHPRVCGEHCLSHEKSPLGSGSSPRMRGALVPHASPRIPRGIIPAYAGSTSSPGRKTRRERDHPRACGEHATKLMTLMFCMGSSPRMRGAQRQAGERPGHHGIIPAYAGST